MPRLSKQPKPETKPPDDPAPMNWPALLDAQYHPDIAKQLHALPFRPPNITHNSTQDELMEANAEPIQAAGAQLYEHLRRPHTQVMSVYQLINATRAFLAMRQKYLKLESDDSEGAPNKPRVVSLG
jgi:hypothetical protein